MIDNMKKRNWIGPPSYLPCGNVEEIMDHLFPNCSYSRLIWDEINGALKILFTPTLVEEMRTMWKRLILEKKLLRARDYMVVTIMWSIWKERNNRAFGFEAKSALCLL